MINFKGYIAPEVEKENACAVSDIYSLGIIFGQMLIPHIPFELPNIGDWRLTYKSIEEVSNILKIKGYLFSNTKTLINLKMHFKIKSKIERSM